MLVEEEIRQETPEMDWSHSPQDSRQQYTTGYNLEPRKKKGKQDDRETRGAPIWKQASEKLDTAGDN